MSEDGQRYSKYFWDMRGGSFSISGYKSLGNEDKMKRKQLVFLGILFCLCLSFTGCKKESKVTLGEYKGITYKPLSVEVSDTEVQAALNQVVSAETTYLTDRTRKGTEVKDGDWLRIDYTGKLKDSDQTFSGGSAKDKRLQIGSGKFIPGFEDALIGQKVGEIAVINVTFPTDYAVNPDMAGKEVVFMVTIHEVLMAKVPELTDALIEKYTEGAHKTIASYKSYVTEYLKQEKETKAKEAARETILKKVISNASFDYVNKDDVKEYEKKVLSYYEAIAKRFSVSLETYVSYYYDKTMDEFNEDIHSIAESTVKEQLVLEKIAEKENITLSDEQYQSMLQNYMERYNYEDKEAMEKDYTIENLRKSMIYDLTIDFLIANAVAEK